MKKDPFTHVPETLRPVPADMWAKHFVLSQEAVFEHIHHFTEQNKFNDKMSLNHRQLCNWIGGKAFTAFESSSSRFWSENDKSNLILEWNLMLWRYIHVLPLGFLVANHTLKSEPYRSWNPAYQSVREFAGGRQLYIEKSNRPLSGNTIALGIYHRIFGHEDVDPSVYRAFLDAFSNLPNADNPFHYALRRAIKNTLFPHPYPLPFYWDECFSQVFARSPDEVAEFRMNLSFGGTEQFDFEAHSRSKGQPVIEVPATVQPQLDESMPETSPVADSASTLPSFFRPLMNVLSSQFNAHPNPVNSKGSMFHRVGNYWFMVHPVVLNIALKEINQQHNSSLDLEYVVKELSKIGFEIAHGQFMEGESVKGKVGLLHWPTDFAEEILCDLINEGGNPTLRVSKSW
jgi:hypothetical protein